MTRAALFALLVASVLNGSLHAQRATASFRGNTSAGWSVRSGFNGHRAFPNRFFSSRSHLHQDSLGPAFFPYDDPLQYAQGGTESEPDGVGPLVVIRSDDRSVVDPERPAPKPLVIEIPAAASLREAKMPAPTVFILESGERVEARRFVLTASALSFSVDRQQRIVPFDMLDINATLNANRERGIDLRIPADRNEISLSF